MGVAYSTLPRRARANPSHALIVRHRLRPPRVLGAPAPCPARPGPGWASPLLLRQLRQQPDVRIDDVDTGKHGAEIAPG